MGLDLSILEGAAVIPKPFVRIPRAKERRCRCGPTSTDHLNLRGKSHSAAKPAVVTILLRWVGYAEGEKVR